jgi:hypothetical protein
MSAFCPRDELVCTQIIFLHSMEIIVSVMEKHCAFSGVGTKSINIIFMKINFLTCRSLTRWFNQHKLVEERQGLQLDEKAFDKTLLGI